MSPSSIISLMKRSASLLILNHQGKLLLLQRGGESKAFRGDWEFPGGKLDLAESPYQAVLREAHEETGLRPDFQPCEPLWRTVTANRSVEYAFFLWQPPAAADLNVTLSNEHQAFEWVSFTGARKKSMLPPHREFMDRYWHQEQIKAYEQELPHYIAYKKFLDNLLNRLKSRWAPLAIVQAREKSLSGFAEKCVRKADKYDDPAHQLTDLCGARIITTTTYEEDSLIRQIQKLFAVDELDDTRRRHDIAEFGYLSVHFIVHIPDGVKEILGEPVPPGLGGRKAEIQVRTMVQHAHSEVTHDRLYKSGFTAPENSRREAARVAAVLEAVDDEFARFVHRLDAYVGHFAAHMPPEKRRREIDDLKLVIQHEPDPAKKPMLALRLARLLRAGWDWSGLSSCVEPYLEGGFGVHPLGCPPPPNTLKRGHQTPEAGQNEDDCSGPVSDCLRMEFGHALCRLHQENPTGTDFRRGIELLQVVAALSAPADAKCHPDFNVENEGLSGPAAG
jgi:ppGpp synthetase/RelA/SpoT-type nucleotidyltranferase/predicted NUDIX family NTP pyrophosphohydrolase